MSVNDHSIVSLPLAQVMPSVPALLARSSCHVGSPVSRGKEVALGSEHAPPAYMAEAAA